MVAAAEQPGTRALAAGLLAPSSRAKALRRMGRVAEARALEQHLRARKKKGAGVPSRRE
jgi:hypothetical protein